MPIFRAMFTALELCRSNLVFCLLKKFWTSSNEDVGLLSWHIYQTFISVVQWCHRNTTDKISPRQLFIFSTLMIFAFSFYNTADLALEPELLCSPVLPSTIHCGVISHTEKVKGYKIPTVQSKGNSSGSTLQASIFFTWECMILWKKLHTQKS